MTINELHAQRESADRQIAGLLAEEASQKAELDKCEAALVQNRSDMTLAAFTVQRERWQTAQEARRVQALVRQDILDLIEVEQRRIAIEAAQPLARDFAARVDEAGDLAVKICRLISGHPIADQLFRESNSSLLGNRVNTLNSLRQARYFQAQFDPNLRQKLHDAAQAHDTVVAE